MTWENKVYNIYKRKFHNVSFKFPVNVFALCNHLKIKIIDYNNISDLTYISKDGFTKYKNNKYYIFLNKDIPEKRQRFTIAHELGHIFLGHFKCGNFPFLIANSGIDEQKEREANLFARLLLAPPKLTVYLKDDEVAKTLNISDDMAKIVNKLKYKDFEKINY